MPLKNEPFTVSCSTCSDWTLRPYFFSSSQRKVAADQVDERDVLAGGLLRLGERATVAG